MWHVVENLHFNASIMRTSRAPIRDAAISKRYKAHEAGDSKSQLCFFLLATHTAHPPTNPHTHAPSAHTDRSMTSLSPAQSQGRLPSSLISVDKLFSVYSVFYQMFVAHIPCKRDAGILPNGHPLLDRL